MCLRLAVFPARVPENRVVARHDLKLPWKSSELQEQGPVFPDSAFDDWPCGCVWSIEKGFGRNKMCRKVQDVSPRDLDCILAGAPPCFFAAAAAAAIAAIAAIAVIVAFAAIVAAAAIAAAAVMQRLASRSRPA